MQTLSGVFQSLGIATTHAELNAALAKVQIPGIKWAGGTVGAVGTLFNIKAFIDKPNWQDGGQIVLGGVALFISGPVGLGAGVTLTVWELYEAYNRAQTPNPTGN